MFRSVVKRNNELISKAIPEREQFVRDTRNILVVVVQKCVFYMFFPAMCLGEVPLNILSSEQFNFIFTVTDVIWMANPYGENLMIISCISQRQIEADSYCNKQKVLF